MVLTLRRALRWLGVGTAAFLVGLSFAALAGQQFPGPGTVIHVICDSGCGGGGGGGGAVTIADGADAAEGSTGDIPWSGVGTGSVVAVLKELHFDLASLPTNLNANTFDSNITALTTSFVFVVPFSVDSRLQRLFVTNYTDHVGHFSLSDGFGVVYFASTPIAPRNFLVVDFHNGNIRFGAQWKADEASTLNAQFIGSIP